MSNSYVIAKGTPDNWEGVYVKSQVSHETTLGFLVEALHAQFGGDIAAMLFVLIADNQFYGWFSVTNRDLRKPPLKFAHWERFMNMVIKPTSGDVTRKYRELIDKIINRPITYEGHGEQMRFTPHHVPLPVDHAYVFNEEKRVIAVMEAQYRKSRKLPTWKHVSNLYL